MLLRKCFFAPQEASDVFAYPTEGVFGLGARVGNFAAVNLISSIKSKRPSQHIPCLFDPVSTSPCQSFRLKRKSFIVLVHPTWSLKDFSPLKTSQVIEASNQLAVKRPISWLIPAHSKCPYWLSYQHKIAIRIPQDESLLRLLERFSEPIISTSLNLAGQRPAQNNHQAQRVVNQIWHRKGIRVGLIKTRRKLPFQSPSLIIDWQTGQRLRS